METNNVKRGRKPKYIHILILNDINVRELNKKHKTSYQDDNYKKIIEYTTPSEPSFFTDLAEITSVNKDSNNYTKDNFITMIDYVNYGCLPEITDINCWHCRHPFSTSPIGAPIKFVSAVKSKKKGVEPINDHYLTCGIFCSFSCILAFLQEHSHERLYINSKSLLYSLYYKIYNKELNIEAAPHWECLKAYGGTLQIEEFRNSYCNCNYIITPNIKRPFMVSVGKYVETKKFGYL